MCKRLVFPISLWDTTPWNPFTRYIIHHMYPFFFPGQHHRWVIVKWVQWQAKLHVTLRWYNDLIRTIQMAFSIGCLWADVPVSTADDGNSFGKQELSSGSWVKLSFHKLNIQSSIDLLLFTHDDGRGTCNTNEGILSSLNHLQHTCLSCFLLWKLSNYFTKASIPTAWFETIAVTVIWRQTMQHK